MKKLGLTVAIATAMGITACGGGSGSSGSSSSGATVGGTASKGILIGGKVSAFLFDSAGAPQTTSIATAITDAEGKYKLKIPAAHNGKPLYIVVDDNAGTATMKCDIVPSCDRDGNPETTDDITSFGETFTLDAGDLELSAVLPESTASVSINITPLTTVAAAVAKSTLAAGSLSVNDFNIKETVNNANSQVANRFGLTGSITAQPVIDLTNSTKVGAAVSSEALKYAALNSAIVSAVQTDAAKKIGQAVKDFAADYSENGLTTKALTSSKTDLSEILASASSVITKVKERVTADLGESGATVVTALSSLGSSIDEDKDVANAVAASDDGDKGTPSPTANATKLAKVKAFVEELRELGAVIDNSLIGSGESAQTVEALANNFEEQLDAAELASSDDVGYSVEALGIALSAIIAVYEDNFDLATGALNETSQIEDLAIETVVTHDGVGVKVIKVNGVVTLSVVQVISVADELDNEHSVSVDIAANVTKLQFTDNKTLDYHNSDEQTGVTNWGDKGSGTGAANISFTGSASTGNARVSLQEGTSAKANLVFSYEGSGSETETSDSDDYRYEDYADFNLSGLDLALKVKIDQTAAAEDQTGGLMSFEGALSAKLSSLRFIEDTLDTWGNDWSGESWSGYRTEEEDLRIKFGTFSLALSGEFKNDETSFDARFSIDGNGKNINYRNIYAFSREYTQQGTVYTESSDTSGETSSKYADVTVKLDFTADLAGISPDGQEEIDFSFMAKRTGFDDGELSASLKYPGRTISIVANAKALNTDSSAIGKLTLTNNDGVQALLTADDSKPDGQDIKLEIRMDTNGDNKIDSKDFLFAWYEQRNGIDLLIFADDKNSDNIEFQSFF